MTSEMHTIEIAKLYESQGYNEDAYQIYLALDKQNSTAQTRAGINRLEVKIAKISESFDNPDEIDLRDLVEGNLVDSDLVDASPDSVSAGSGSKERIARLCEKWVNLIVLKHRLNRFKKIKSRLL